MIAGCCATLCSLLAGRFCAEAETSDPATAKIAATPKAENIRFMAYPSVDPKIGLRALVNIKHLLRLALS